MAMVRIEQRQQGGFAFGIGVDEPSDRLGGVLESCGNSICLQENFGGGGEQRRVRLDGGGDLRPEAGLARGGEVEQVSVRTFQKGFFDMSEQRPLQAREGLHLGDRAGDEIELSQGGFLLDLAG